MKGILTTPEGDIALKDGHIALADTTTQTVQLALTLIPASLKEQPLLGGNIQAQLGGNTDPFWPGRMKEMLRSLAIDVEQISIQHNSHINIILP